MRLLDSFQKFSGLRDPHGTGNLAGLSIAFSQGHSWGGQSVICAEESLAEKISKYKGAVKLAPELVAVVV